MVLSGLSGDLTSHDVAATSTINATAALHDHQEPGVEQFNQQGFTIYRGALSAAECERAVAATYRAIDAGLYVGKKYPAPGKITVARNDWTDPDLATIAAHPRVLRAIEPILGGPARLQAFVSYLRTPEEIKWETEGDPAIAAGRSHDDGVAQAAQSGTGASTATTNAGGQWAPQWSGCSWSSRSQTSTPRGPCWLLQARTCEPPPCVPWLVLWKSPTRTFRGASMPH